MSAKRTPKRSTRRRAQRPRTARRGWFAPAVWARCTEIAAEKVTK